MACLLRQIGMIFWGGVSSSRTTARTVVMSQNAKLKNPTDWKMLTCWAKQNTEVCSSLWLPSFTLSLLFCILIAAPVRKYLSSWIAFHFFLLFFMSWFSIIILLYLWHLKGQLSHCNLIAFCSVFKQSFIQTIPTTEIKSRKTNPSGYSHTF